MAEDPKAGAGNANPASDPNAQGKSGTPSPEAGSGAPGGGQPDKTVPITALHEERDKRQALQAQLDQFKQIMGDKVASLLDTEKPVAGITASPIRSDMQAMALITREDGGQLQPKELAVTVGWGHVGQNGVVMPGKGKAVKRDYTEEEKQAIRYGSDIEFN